jgi:hypothetical protein
MDGYEVQHASAAFPLVFLLISSTDHITGLTGATATVTISKNGGTFASPSGAVTEIGNGWYQVAGNATDTGTLGPIILHASATGSDPTDALYPVVAVNPQSAAYGLSLSKTTNITGFNDIAATAIVSGGAITTSSGAVSNVTTVTTVGGVTGNVGGSVGSISGVAFPSGFSGLTTAAIATSVWTDTVSADFATASSPGKILVSQLGGTFTTTTSSVFSAASLANAPTGGGGSGPTVSQIVTGVWTDLLSSSDFSTSGSVGALVKANTVAAVTGNIGGNVAGSVGSVLNAPFKINTANGFEFSMVSSTDHVTPYTAGGVSAVRSIAGGAESSVSGTVTQIGSSNRYFFSGLAADFNGTSIGFSFSAAGADSVVISVNTQP